MIKLADEEYKDYYPNIGIGGNFEGRPIGLIYFLILKA